MTTQRRVVLLYEYACSGGLIESDAAFDHSAVRDEGWAMLRALATDLAAMERNHVQVIADYRGLPRQLPGCELVWARRKNEDLEILRKLSPKADWTIVIAPEFDGILFERGRCVECAGGRLLGAPTPLVELLADKQRTAGHLHRHGMRVPRGMLWSPGDHIPTLSPPLVIKPNDGAGSQDTYLCRNAHDVFEVLRTYRRHARIEEFVGGMPASVAFLCGLAGSVALPACSQSMALDQKLQYMGGSLPLEPTLAIRAHMLASRAIDCLPRMRGYVGVDLVLGDPSDGLGDYVIEINPRLTTSYVGLRELARSNLAEAMIDIAAGRMPHLSFSSKVIRFDNQGNMYAGPVPPRTCINPPTASG
jgi:tyramine---L-glutamate ligase